MAYEVIPTATFEAEYDSIITYHIETLHSPQAAQRFIAALSETRARLADNPMIHAVSRKPLLDELELREALVRSYVLVYRIDSQRVFLEHLFHQSQDFERLA